MFRKRLKSLMAISLSAVMCVTACPTMTWVKAATADAGIQEVGQIDTENTVKVEVDAAGNLVAAEDTSSLENQAFSWDNATVYFVLTDRFKNGDTSNDHSYGRGMQADGKTPVEGLDTYTNPGTFHGGDLKGMTEKVEEGYFNDLGVNAIWITAPYEQIHGYTSGNKRSNNVNTYPDSEHGGFPYYSYHGYWTLDYTNIDANMGTEADFEKFVDTCHEHGIRVVMDVVMNHVGYTTMQDAVDYDFDGALKGDWKSYYYGNATYLMGGDPESTNYWDKDSSAWANWWGPAFVKADYPGYTAAGGGDTEMSLCGLPDVRTSSSAPEGDTPPMLVNKWTKEGRLEKEQGELDAYFSRTGNKKQARYYIIKWLTDWVREYGVDGFRCDTAKHVELDAWKDLKTEALSALEEWRQNNPDKAGAQWDEDFWMTGECWGHGMSKSPYHTSGGFDSMINFGFPKNGTPSGMEETYKSYAAINDDSEWNTLSYINSHDDNESAKVTWGITTDKMKDNGTCLLLSPGGAQIYYGNEVNRGLGWTDFFTGNDYLDQRFRTDMDWTSYDKDCLAHWQKVGQFRNKHLSVGAGQHEKLEGEAYTFSRTYHLEEDDEDKVVCCLPGTAGTYKVPVGDVFEDGETVTDFYSGEKYEVSGGSVSATCDANGVILLEGSGIVKASVGIKSNQKSETYSAETFQVTLKANKAKDTKYSINGGTTVPFNTGDQIVIGGDTAYEEETTITVTGVSEDDGSTLTKTVTYKRSAEPEVSGGELCIKVKKSDFPTAPNVFIYTNDAAEKTLSSAWPGPVMTEDDEAEYWSYTLPEYEDEACFILSLGASANSGGTWRSTPDKAKGLVAKAAVEYDKTTGTLKPLPVGPKGTVTINYEDEAGNVLKSIYRVGAIGKNYTTYPAAIEGYTLKTTPDNAKGIFEENSTVTYVYSSGGGGVILPVTPTISGPVNSGGDITVPSSTPGGNNQNQGTPGPNVTASVTTVAPPSTNRPTQAPGGSGSNNDNGNNNGNNNNGNNNNGSNNNGNNNVTPNPIDDIVHSGGQTQAPASKTPGASNAPTATPVVSATPSNTSGNLAVKLTTDITSPQMAGSSITLQAKATGGSGSYQYQYYVTETSEGVSTYLQKEFGNADTYVWKPTKAGQYTVYVVVKDTKTGTQKSDSISFTVNGNSKDNAKFQISKLKITKARKKIKIKAQVTGASGSVQYKYVVSGKGKKYSTGYKKQSTATIKLAKKGVYTVTVYAKCSSGTVKKTKKIKY